MKSIRVTRLLPFIHSKKLGGKWRKILVSFRSRRRAANWQILSGWEDQCVGCRVHLTCRADSWLLWKGLMRRTQFTLSKRTHSFYKFSNNILSSNIHKKKHSCTFKNYSFYTFRTNRLILHIRDSLILHIQEEHTHFTRSEKRTKIYISRNSTLTLHIQEDSTH